jgi:hypothetical protein
MTLSRSLVRADGSVGTEPADHRKAYGALLARSSTSGFGTRPGVLWGCRVTGTTSTSPWQYSVSAGGLVTVRATAQGAYPAAIDGATLVDTDPAPGSGSRIDIIYARQNDVDVSDADNLPVLDVAIGTASGSPVAPSIPAGAIELARNTMTNTATNTASAGNTIVHTSSPLTSLQGGVYDVPSTAELVRIASPEQQAVARIPTEGGTWVYRGTVWDRAHILRAGEVSAATNSNGDGSVTISPAFPNGIANAVLTDSSTIGVLGHVRLKYNPAGSSASSVAFRAYDSAGNALVSNAAVRVSYIAVGW